MATSGAEPPFVFPAGAPAGTTSIRIRPREGRLPWLEALGPGPLGEGRVGLGGDAGPGVGLLDSHWEGRFTRPSLRGHRLAASPGDPATGRDWSPAFETGSVEVSAERLLVRASDPVGGLRLVSELESLPGGALRARHTITNAASGPYLLEALEVVLPISEHLEEILDFTGRWGAERAPQRHSLTDGLWLREQRRGKPGADGPYVVVVGARGFGFGHGEVVGCHVAWSGNSVLGVERTGASTTTLRGGELLAPGEVVLGPEESYSTPWVYVVASDDGLDGIAGAFHRWLRSRPVHPARQPVTCNVWEAVYFDQDPATITTLAGLAARIGVERFVIDDGWFSRRRHDRAGLGDWWIDPEVWPEGLAPLSAEVHRLGMEMGLWFEPEMVNPDSALYDQHPEWILATGDRVPLLSRNQLVLDLGRPEVRSYLADALSSVLTEAAVDYVKWDHNRELLDAGSGLRAGGPGIHDHTVGFYSLLDELRSRHPSVAFESCSSGGGRIDLEVLERTTRVWTSDNTDPLSRQSIQRWSTQLAAPEYLGAHVASPRSHQTGRWSTLDFRAVTALPYAFGVEWDLRQAEPEELERLGAWISLHKRFRELLHSGRAFRSDVAEPAVVAHGAVAPEGTEALVVIATLGEPDHDRPVGIPVPGLAPDRNFTVEQLDPQADPVVLGTMSGRAAGSEGIHLGRQRPQSALVVHFLAL